jgi:hypothetical protein
VESTDWFCIEDGQFLLGGGDWLFEYNSSSFVPQFNSFFGPSSLTRQRFSSAVLSE